LNVTSSREQVTVVVPYYNERDTLPYLLQQLTEQTLPPYEVILVNSGGSDGSSQLVDEWISTQRSVIRFTNLNASTTTPGGSKTAGVKTSQSSLFAFMDCGLSFPKDWLQRQSTVLQNDNVDWVSGVCLTNGTTLVDKAAIAHTYGYLTARPVIPGSLVRRRVFDRIGFFRDLRAGYDAEWARASERAGLRREVNRDVVVEYRGINFAQDIRGVFLKSLRYARPSVGRDDTVVPHVYVLAAVIGVATAVAALVGAVPVWLPVVGVVLYLVARLAIASRKSRQISYFWRSPVRLMLLLLVGLVMDIGKTYGFAMGIITRFLRRRSLVS
jgi:glycosyltransferase involved in cell wall biosynthesis